MVTDVWQTCYLSINQCNFILAGIAEAIADDRLGFDADTQRRLELVKGRCYLIRALSYSTLAERFCAAYDKATASKEFSGVPWIDEYDPDKKPGRATLEEIYGHIKQDIAEAKSRLQSQPGSANAIFLNRDCRKQDRDSDGFRYPDVHGPAERYERFGFQLGCSEACLAARLRSYAGGDRPVRCG